MTQDLTRDINYAEFPFVYLRAKKQLSQGWRLESGAKGNLGPVVQIDEGRIQARLDEVVRSKVEETLTALLDAEADRLCERSGGVSEPVTHWSG